jgi:hypothetical protein
MMAAALLGSSPVELIVRIISAATDPQLMEQNRQLARHGDHGALLAFFPPR